VTGQVLQVDRFGNLITNLTRQTITGVDGDALTVVVGSERLGPIVATYGEAPFGAVCALFGSSGYLEVAVNGGSAADRLHLTRGATVVVSPG
jgi:S-adenosylmethionine hydrolase